MPANLPIARTARVFRVDLANGAHDEPTRTRRACAPAEIVVLTDGSCFARYHGQSLLRFNSLEELLQRFAIDAAELDEARH